MCVHLDRYTVETAHPSLVSESSNKWASYSRGFRIRRGSGACIYKGRTVQHQAKPGGGRTRLSTHRRTRLLNWRRRSSLCWTSIQAGSLTLIVCLTIISGEFVGSFARQEACLPNAASPDPKDPPRILVILRHGAYHMARDKCTDACDLGTLGVLRRG
jgi:hypothetical protein